MCSDDSSSERSLFASPSRSIFPSLAFAGAMSIPFKSPISPPSTASSDFNLSPVSAASTTSSDFSLFSTTPPSSAYSPSFASTAYPDWPKRDILSPLSSFCGSQASSHISDEDLLDLAQLDLCEDVAMPGEKTAGISWEATKQPPLVLQSVPVQQQMRPISKRRRRSSPLNKRKMVAGMSPIAEGAE